MIVSIITLLNNCNDEVEHTSKIENDWTKEKLKGRVKLIRTPSYSGFGSNFESYILFNSNGYITETGTIQYNFKPPKKSIKESRFYHENGNLSESIKYSYYPNSFTKCLYNDKGDIVSLEETSDTYNNNTFNNEPKRKRYTDKTYEYETTSKGNLLRKEFNYLGELIHTIEYDKHKNPVVTTTFDKLKSSSIKTTYTYDNKGNILKEKSDDSKDYMKFAYDKKGNLINKTEYLDGLKYYITDYRYDAENRRIEFKKTGERHGQNGRKELITLEYSTTQYDSNGNYIGDDGSIRFKYENDKNGNWIKRTEYDRPSTIRIIEYYD